MNTLTQAQAEAMKSRLADISKLALDLNAMGLDTTDILDEVRILGRFVSIEGAATINDLPDFPTFGVTA